MNDLVIQLDNLLKDRRLAIDLIAKHQAKIEDGHTPHIWDRAVFALTKRIKRQIDYDVVTTFNKLSTLETDTFINRFKK